VTVKEFINLAIILLLGLMVNHCAFDNDITQYEPSRSLRTIDERIEQRAENFDQRMNQVSEELDQKMERLDQKMEKLGDSMDMDVDIEKPEAESEIEKGVKITSTRTESPGGETTLAIVGDLADFGSVKSFEFTQIPAEMLVVLNGCAPSIFMLNMSGGGEIESPDITDEGAGRIIIDFSGAMPKSAQATLPPGIAEVFFGEDEAVRLALEPSGAVLHLDSAVGKLNIKRSGDWVTLSHQDWSVRIKGLTQPLQVVDADGAELGKLDAGKASELSIVLDGEGGAQ
jgi:hypothetical protein